MVINHKKELIRLKKAKEYESILDLLPTGKRKELIRKEKLERFIDKTD